MTARKHSRAEAIGLSVVVLVLATLILIGTGILPLPAGGNAALATRSAMRLALSLGVSFAMLMAWRGYTQDELGLVVDARTPKHAAAGTALGAVTAVVAFAVAWAGGGYDVVHWASRADQPTASAALGRLVALALGAAFEEVVFRSALVGVLDTVFPRIVAVLVPALPFALAHLMNPHVSAAAEANIVLAGAVLGLLFFEPYGRPALGVCVGWHTGWNATVDALGIPVSGHAPEMRWLDVHPASTLLSGGEFGIEAGLGTTLVLAALALAVGARRRGARLSRVA